MKTSQAGLDLIKASEGYVDHAYPDPATGAEPITIGYGSTYADGQKVVMGMTCTEEDALRWLMQEVEHKVESKLPTLIKVELSQGQFDAIVSFCYNVGMGNFSSSTLLKKLNAGDYEGASNEFPKWNKGAGKVLPGLVRRREAERQLFLS